MLVVVLGNNITDAATVSLFKMCVCVAFVGDEIMMLLSLTSLLGLRVCWQVPLVESGGSELQCDSDPATGFEQIPRKEIP